MDSLTEPQNTIGDVGNTTPARESTRSDTLSRSERLDHLNRSKSHAVLRHYRGHVQQSAHGPYKLFQSRQISFGSGQWDLYGCRSELISE